MKILMQNSIWARVMAAACRMQNGKGQAKRVGKLDGEQLRFLKPR